MPAVLGTEPTGLAVELEDPHMMIIVDIGDKITTKDRREKKT